MPVERDIGMYCTELASKSIPNVCLRLRKRVPSSWIRPECMNARLQYVNILILFTRSADRRRL